MKNHTMNLAPSPFEMIRSKEKTIELRLYDEKRRTISVGDTITFINIADSEETLKAKVEHLYVFKNFAELYENLPLLECGYTSADIATAHPRDMEEYYPSEKQALYGALGIKISLLDFSEKSDK